MRRNREGMTRREWTGAARYGTRAPNRPPTARERAAWRAGEDPTEWSAAYQAGTEPLPGE